jgi:hypothetical protein
VLLEPDDLAYARRIGRGRYERGGPSREPDSGKPSLRVDRVGAMAEVAVCRFYGEDPHTWVTVHLTRPGAVPDLVHKNKRVSVKGRERWVEPLDMIVPQHDTDNDVYMLVSVEFQSGVCGLQGWLYRDELLRYPLQMWQWTGDRPGSVRTALRRYVPVADLHPCRPPTVPADDIRPAGL